MLFSKTIKLLICLVIILPYIVQAPQARAATNYDHNALLEYKGYGEAMYETIVDQTTFVTGQYTENKEYVSQSIDQIKSYADFWLKEQGNLKDACSGLQIFTKNCLGELTSSAGGYALTVGDFIKNLFTDYGNDHEGLNAISTDNISRIDGEIIYLNDGYRIGFTVPGGTKTYFITSAGTYYANNTTSSSVSKYFSGDFNSYLYKNLDGGTKEKNQAIAQSACNITGVSSLMSCMNWYGANTHLEYLGTPVNTGTANPIYKNFHDKIVNNEVPKMMLPQPKAYLSCPDGTKIDMAINGATFLDATGQVMNVNTDGTAEVSSQICNLGWDKQEVAYVDDKAAITDSDGNWMDIVTGELLECVLLEKCEVGTKPPAEVEPIDNTLVEYVKNAYEYATSVLKTATDGLKSLGEGAKELTALFGVFFSWLPRDMVVLMASGLGITIGLRLFRK